MILKVPGLGSVQAHWARIFVNLARWNEVCWIEKQDDVYYILLLTNVLQRTQTMLLGDVR